MNRRDGSDDQPRAGLVSPDGRLSARRRLICAATVLTTVLVAFALGGCVGPVSGLPDSDDVARRVLDVEILDTDDYQGPSPRNLTARAGEEVELRVTNRDTRTTNGAQSANSHPISIRGPGVSQGFLSLRPGQTASIVFTAQAGTYTFSCMNTGCDIHTRMTGTIEVAP